MILLLQGSNLPPLPHYLAWPFAEEKKDECMSFPRSLMSENSGLLIPLPMPLNKVPTATLWLKMSHSFDSSFFYLQINQQSSKTDNFWLLVCNIL